MLEIVRFGEDEYDFPCLLVLGCFDGLHVGHAELLKKAKLQAKINGLDLGVMMFSEGKGGKQLYSFEERIAFLEQYNVKFVLKIDFNEDFKKIKPLEFLEQLEDKLNLKAYMSGKDFKFGQGKKGKSSTLKSYADDEENSVWYMSVKEVTCGEEKVSTTRIKELLDAGDVRRAGELLGRNYSLSGNVIHGADRGGKVVGYPTMNIDFPAEKYPVKEGVYKVKCRVGENIYDGIANYGARPTFDENSPVLEVYLENFEGEHYGETVGVEFVDYLRDIQKFDGAEQLGEQLSKDILCLMDGELAVTLEEQTKPTDEVSSISVEVPVETSETVTQSAPTEETAFDEDEFEAELNEVTDIESVENIGESEDINTQELAESPDVATPLEVYEQTEKVCDEKIEISEDTVEGVSASQEELINCTDDAMTEEILETQVETVEDSINEEECSVESSEDGGEIFEEIHEIQVETAEDLPNEEECSVESSEDDGEVND